jgi:hypothetical protein
MRKTGGVGGGDESEDRWAFIFMIDSGKGGKK